MNIKLGNGFTISDITGADADWWINSVAEETPTK